MPDEKSTGQGETEAKKPTCFVVSPIGAAGSPERKHANVTLKFIIEPVLERCGFQKALRADTLGESGIISRQIISQLLNADLVIADLTFHNPNVYYELAIRHGTGKPFVQLHTRGQTLPFDVAQQRTIFFDRTDLEDVEDCKAELERQIKAAIASKGPMDTPIGQTLDYETLRSGGPMEQTLAQLTDQVAKISQAAVRTTSRHESYWGPTDPLPPPEPEPTSLEPLIRLRSQKFLADWGFQASVPEGVIREILDEVVTRSSPHNPTWTQIDEIIQPILENRLVGPRKIVPDAKLR
jgi:hypothetical protein